MRQFVKILTFLAIAVASSLLLSSPSRPSSLQFVASSYRPGSSPV